MKVLKDGTVRIEFRDKEKGLYIYKDITKEMILKFKNGKKKKNKDGFNLRKQGDIKIDDIPSWTDSQEAYCESAHYYIMDKTPLCNIFVTRYEVKNKVHNEKLFKTDIEL
jgi:hypothetical protein